jgi:hypothetical protein
MPTLAQLSDVFGGGKDLIPHIEMGAIQYTMRQYAMAARVLTFTDMSGYNDRKISEYLKYRRAQNLQEATDIPKTSLARSRKAEIAPKEIGDRYPITNRRWSTDLEPVIRDSVRALGQGLGDRIETDLVNVGVTKFVRNLGSSVTAYSLDLPINIQTEMKQEARNETLYHVIHPFQARDILKSLIVATGSTAGVALNYRENAISTWTVPGFGGLEVVVDDFIPRRVINRCRIFGTGGTFRLALFDGQVAGVNLTAAITVSATPATTVANIKAALEALTFNDGESAVDGGYPVDNGTWTVAGAANNDITITPPANLFLDGDSELRVAVDYSNPTQWGEKSAYDLITGLSGAPLDVNGASKGVDFQEKSASAKSLMFAREAIVYDVREGISAYFEEQNQGRTVEFSAHTTYGVGLWRPELGWTIETVATSALAVA